MWKGIPVLQLKIYMQTERNSVHYSKAHRVPAPLTNMFTKEFSVLNADSNPGRLSATESKHTRPGIYTATQHSVHTQKVSSSASQSL